MGHRLLGHRLLGHRLLGGRLLDGGLGGQGRFFGRLKCLELLNGFWDAVEFGLREFRLVDPSRDHQESVERNFLLPFFGRLLGFRRFEASAGTFPKSEQVLNAVLEGDLKISIHGKNLVTVSCGSFLCEKAASLQSQFGFVTELLDFEVSGHARGLSGNIDDSQIIQRALHFVELRGIEFLANIKQSRSRLALLVDGHRRWIPLRFADVVSDIGIVVRDELEGVLIGRQERVVAYA